MASSTTNESIEQTIKFLIEEVLGNQPVEEIMEKSGAIDLAIEKAKAENKNIVNMIINKKSSEINPQNERNFFQRKAMAKRELGETIIKKIIEVVPEKYTENLWIDLNEITKSISQFLQNPKNLSVDFSLALNRLLENLENPFVDITTDKLEVIPKIDHQELRCSFIFTIKKNVKQPVVIISTNPQLGLNPLMKMKFKIEGEISFYDMIFSHVEDLKISLGEFDINLNIVIEEIQIMKTPIMSEEHEKVLYAISSKNIKNKLADIVIRDN